VSRNGFETVDNYMIPPMIVQPFVENAILHGLRNKEGEKKLAVTFSKENENIICQVVDNGIGRKAAHENKYKRLPMFESKGIKLTEYRLRVLKATTQRNFLVEIVDLYNNERPSGTKVILTFAHT
jgi:two-component system LytT family sensor kinase